MVQHNSFGGENSDYDDFFFMDIVHLKGSQPMKHRLISIFRIAINFDTDCSPVWVGFSSLPSLNLSVEPQECKAFLQTTLRSSVSGPLLTRVTLRNSIVAPRVPLTFANANDLARMQCILAD